MIIKYDNKAVKYTNKWVSIGGVTPPPVPTVYSVYTLASTGGSVSAVPSSGISGTEVTLSNTPDTNYTFSSYSVTGATLKNSNQFDIGNSDVYVKGNFTNSDPYNPLNLPAYTIRVQLTDTSYDCSTQGFNGTWVSRGNGVWDVTYNNTIWSRLLTDTIGFWGRRKEHRILGMNSTDVTNMERFEDVGHEYLIGTIPLFDTTALTDVTNMFYECYYVEGGALALYQQMSTQTNIPSYHSGCFKGCGRDTVIGAAELEQIPYDWKDWN